MPKIVTIFSLIFLFFNIIYAQDQPIKKAPRLASIKTKPHFSDIQGNGHPINGLLALRYALPNNGYYFANSVAPTGTYRYERSVYLITPAEMVVQGFPIGINFNQIEWTYYTPGNRSVTGTLKIYLQNTTDVVSTKGTTWSTNISTMTLVDNNASFTNPSDYNVIETFTNPTAFIYTGGGLYVAFDYSNPSNTLSTGTNINLNINLPNGTYYGQDNSLISPTINSSSARPETYLGFSIGYDAQVAEVNTLGKFPIPYAAPHQVMANIQNNGDNSLTNLNVILNITGANTFTDTKTIDVLPSGENKFVTFSSWTPTNSGIDTVKVSVPSDEININNSLKIIQQTNINTYSYAYGPFPPSSDGGAGFNGFTGDFVAKFSTSSSSSVSQITVDFINSGQPFKLGIWDASGINGIPGTLLWQSALLISSSGTYTIPVNPKVNVNGNFYVGIRQTSTTNIGLAYQSENPIRPGVFYAASPTGSTEWFDFSTSGNPFRFIIEPGLTITNDVGVSTVDFPQSGSYNNIVANTAPKITVANFGSNNQSSSFNTTVKIYDHTGSQVYTSTKSLTLNSGAQQQVTFDASFTPTAQLYTAKYYTSLASDGNKNNDTVTASFNFSQFSLGMKALVEAMYVNGGTEMSMAPSVTVELHDASTYALVESKTATLSTAGLGTFNFTTAITGSTPYYLVIKSLSTVETWSATPQSFPFGSLSYDFTTGIDKAYTDGSNPPLALHNGKYCIYSGDVNQDGFLTSDDFTGIDNDILLGIYHIVNDLNGDNFITSDDFTFVDNNVASGLFRQVPPGAPGFLIKQSIKSQDQ